MNGYKHRDLYGIISFYCIFFFNSLNEKDVKRNIATNLCGQVYVYKREKSLYDIKKFKYFSVMNHLFCSPAV